MSFKFAMEPRVTFLTELLREIDEGILQIPRFQRDFVWDWAQQNDLLCSIMEGLPIGAILVWSTRLDNIKSYDHIGPFPIKSTHTALHKTYLMDGLQRLGTLYCTLFHPMKEDYNNLINVNDYFVYCDLDSDSVDNLFILKSATKAFDIDTDKNNYMPLRYAFDFKELLKFQRKIPEDKEHWLDKSDEIASAFKNYKIPIVPLESDKQELVTKSFERINTRGTVMSETHMLNALSYSQEFDLLEEIEKNRNEYLSEYSGWYDIDPEIILAVVKMELGYDIYSKKTDEIAKNIDKKILHKVFNAFREFIIFSKNELNITNPKLYPYKLQMYGLVFSFVHEKTPQNDILKAWYLITTYTGAFGATARNSTNALSDLISFLDTGKFKWSLNIKPSVHIWSENVVFKTARVKAWANALSSQIDNKLALNNETRSLLMEKKGNIIKKPSEFSQIISKRAGYFFIIDSTKVKNFSIYDLSAKEKEANFIDEYIMSLLSKKDYESFAMEREKLIFNWELQYLIKPSALKLNFSDIVYD